MHYLYDGIWGKLRMSILVFFLINRSVFSAEIIFPGGTLADLEDLSPTLTFEDLTITGKLYLPPGGAATLHVDSLTITDTGGVGYSYSECTYRPAPDFTVTASGNVTVNGEIKLTGRSGARTTSSATCKQCWGEPGGDLRITASNILITADIDNHGGSGGTSVSIDCSSGCSGGQAGGIFLEGTNISISDTKLETYGGNGGLGTCYGSPSPGSDGDPGQIVIVASNQFKMHQSIVSTDGTVTLSAAESEIFGPILTDIFDVNIGGIIDELGPEVEVLAPLPDSVLNIDQSIEVRIRANDTGTGVKEIKVEGLGYSQLHTADEMQNGILTFTIMKPLAPATLQVKAWDNLGNSTVTSVSGLSLASDLIISEGEILEIIGDLNLGPEISITVSGNLIIKRGTNPKISANSLRITAAGIIKDEEQGPQEIYSKAPSLELVLQGQATIDGTIDLSGNEDWDYYTEDGGDITIQAAGISVTGNLKADGAHSTRKRGGHGGIIALKSSLSLQVSGSMSSTGGGSTFSYGGDGGTVSMNYLTIGSLASATLDLSMGSGWTGSGTVGNIESWYLGGSNPVATLTVKEVEPNSFVTDAQEVLVPVQVNGSVTQGDVGDLYLGNDIYEDLFVLKLSKPLAITVELVPVASDRDLDLLVVRDEDYVILGSGLQGVGITERIQSLALQPDTYFVMVSQFGEIPPEGSSYRLSISPTAGIDSDEDGLSDWWEEVHFVGLDHDGTLDSDADFLSDASEYNEGTHPLIADTDGDGMKDGWEISQGFDPLVTGLIGLSMRVELRPATPGSTILIQGYPGQHITLQRSENLETWENITTTTGIGFFKEYFIPEPESDQLNFYRVLSP